MESPTPYTPNYYEVLGVSKDAPPEEIKQRYKTLVLKFHPDRECSALAKEAMVVINNAYEILSDPQTRGSYDLVLSKPSETLHYDIPHRKRVLLVVRISKRSLALIAIALSISFLVGYQAETLQGYVPVSDQFVRANSHYFTAITHEVLVTLPLFIPGIGLLWGVLGGFTFGFVDKAILLAAHTSQAGLSGHYLLYLALAVAIKLISYYLGMVRSLTLLVSIKRRRFSKLDSMGTQVDIIIAMILSAVAGLVEHSMINAR